MKVLALVLICAALAFAQQPAELAMVGAGGPSTTASWTTLNYTCGHISGGSPNACTWSTNVPKGASVVCAASNFNNAPTFSVTDSNSDAFTGIGSPFHTVNGYWTQLFYFSNLPNAISTSTVTVLSGTVSFLLIQCQAATGGPIFSVDGTSTGGSANSPAVISPNITTTRNGDWLVFFGSSGAGVVLVAGSCCTAGSNGGGSNTNVLGEYAIQTTAGLLSPTPSFTYSTGGGNGSIIGGAFSHP